MIFFQRKKHALQLIFIVPLFVLFLINNTYTAETEDLSLIANGGFEDGVKGWMYHQWTGKKSPGYIDGADVYEGKASFKMTEKNSSKGRYIAKEIKFNDTDKDHVLLFALKTTNMDPGTARVRFSIEGFGWLRSNGNIDLVHLGGTQGWKLYGFLVSGKKMKGKTKGTLFFYHDRLNKGMLGIDAVSFRPGNEDDIPAGAVPTKLTGTTSNSLLNTFSLGKPVKLSFKAEGLIPNGPPLTLSIKIVDEHDKQIAQQSLSVSGNDKGRWNGAIDAPCKKLGFYKVIASLSNGVSLEAQGSRESGFLTYAVVPDPKDRKDYGQNFSRFGMQGGFGPWKSEVLSFLGARWVLDDRFKWRRLEGKPDIKFTADNALKKWKPASAKGWKTYSLPTLYEVPKWATRPETFSYCTGTLTPTGEKEWVRYCKEAVTAYAALNPASEKNIYQITWEPIQPWGFKGTNADLTRIYELVYSAIHEADPKAVVAGPCRGADKNEVQRTDALLKTGLAKYLDAFTVHPYFSKQPETEGMVRQLRAMRKVLFDNTKHAIPMYGTEQGLSTHERPQEDLEQAQILMRQNLITLGEGYQFNMAFFIVDYRLAGQKGYGYYYNLENGVPWGPRKVSPRPVVPAYAAQSLLLDGANTLGAIETLGKGILGYVFEREGLITLALWNYGSSNKEISVPTGVPTVQQYDWMGNASTKKTTGGMASVTLTGEPTYLVGVSEKLWGKSKGELLRVLTPEVSISDKSPVIIECQINSQHNTINGKVMFIPDSRMNIKAKNIPVRISAEGSKNISFTIDSEVQNNLVSGTYPLQVMLQENGMITALNSAKVKIVAPIEISRTKVTGPRQISLYLQNHSKVKQKGKLNVKLEQILKGKPRPDLPMIDLPEGKVQLIKLIGSELNSSFVLDPLQRKEVVFNFDHAPIHPCHQYRLTAKISAGENIGEVYNQNIDFLVSKFISTPPTIDGDISDWKKFPPAVLKGKEAVTRSAGKYTGDNDLSAEVRFSWDKKALYMAFAVSDDKWCQLDRDAMIWRGDCLQIATDVSKMSNSATPLHTEFALTLSSDGPQAYRHISFDPQELALGHIENEIEFAVKRTDKGLDYEVSIPWRCLGLNQEPKSGDVLKIACSINDRDEKSQTDPTAIGIFDGIAPSKDTDLFGTMILTE